MGSSTPKPKTIAADRRANPGASGAAVALRRAKGALSRPLGIERRGKELHVVLVDRRRAAPPPFEPTTAQLRAELRTRLLASEDAQTTQVMRHIGFIHDCLGRKGWKGVEALPPQVLGLAQVQAEMLAGDEPSALMSALIDRLRSTKAAADAREERKQRLQGNDLSKTLRVSESTLEEFEAMERSWVDVLPVDSPVDSPAPERNA